MQNKALRTLLNYKDTLYIFTFDIFIFTFDYHENKSQEND